MKTDAQDQTPRDDDTGKRNLALESADIQLITEKSNLPPLTRTQELTLYKGYLPVIIFSAKAHREYLNYPHSNWPGWATAKELARNHFATHAKCTRIEALFMNEPGADTEADYGGAHLRSYFEKGGIYADGEREQPQVMSKQTPDKHFSINPNYTHEELVAHFTNPRNDGFSAASCGGCRATVNLSGLSYQMGWGCPACGHFNVGHFSGGFQIPHERADFGPTRAEIEAAVKEASLPETAEALRLPEHLRTFIVSGIADMREEDQRDVVYEKGLYVVALKEFCGECVLTITTFGLCYATIIDGDRRHMCPAQPARSPEAAALIFNQTRTRQQMNNEPSHDNTGTGEGFARTYTTDTQNTTLPYYIHECPGCQFVGCYIAAGGHRFDLYFCARGSEPCVVVRIGNPPQAWAATEYRHAGMNNLYHSDHALARAAKLASEQGLISAEQSERAILDFTDETQTFDFAAELADAKASDIVLVRNEEEAARARAACAFNKSLDVVHLCEISGKTALVGRFVGRNARVIGRLHGDFYCIKVDGHGPAITLRKNFTLNESTGTGDHPAARSESGITVTINSFPCPTADALRALQPGLLPAFTALLGLASQQQGESGSKPAHPESFAIRQEDRTAHRTLQVALAVTVIESFQWNSLLVIPDEHGYDLQRLALLARDLSPNVTIKIVDEEFLKDGFTLAQKFLAIATVSNLRRAAIAYDYFPADAFDLIISAEESLDPATPKETYTQYFPLSHVICAWSRNTPSNDAVPIRHAGGTLIYSITDLAPVLKNIEPPPHHDQPRIFDLTGYKSITQGVVRETLAKAWPSDIILVHNAESVAPTRRAFEEAGQPDLQVISKCDESGRLALCCDEQHLGKQAIVVGQLTGDIYCLRVEGLGAVLTAHSNFRVLPEADYSRHAGPFSRSYKHTGQAVRENMPEHEPALSALMKEAGIRDWLYPRSGTGSPTRLVVCQDDSAQHQALQLGVAAACAESLQWRTLLVLPDAVTPALESLAALCRNLYPHTTFLILNEEGIQPATEQPPMITITTERDLKLALSAKSTPASLLLAPDQFQVIMTSARLCVSIAGVLANYAISFPKAEVIIIWSRLQPTKDAPLIASANDTLIFQADNLWTDAGGTTTLIPTHSRRELVEAAGRAWRWTDQALKSTPPENPPAIHTPEVKHPYQRLPPRAEMRIATVLTITPETIIPADSGITHSLPESDAQPGMYILVPERFPGQCNVVLTCFGHYARIQEGATIHEFHVWPSPTVAAAEQRYEEVRAKGTIYPRFIGAITTINLGKIFMTNRADKFTDLTEPYPMDIRLHQAEGYRDPELERELAESRAEILQNNPRRSLIPSHITSAIEAGGYEFQGEYPHQSSEAAAALYLLWRKDITNIPTADLRYNVQLRIYLADEPNYRISHYEIHETIYRIGSPNYIEDTVHPVTEGEIEKELEAAETQLRAKML